MPVHPRIVRQTVTNWQDEDSAISGGGRAAWTAHVSFAFIVVAVALTLRDPDILGSGGTLLERLFGALLAVGVIGNALNGFRWRGNRLLQVIASPAFAWPAIVAGVSYGMLS